MSLSICLFATSSGKPLIFQKMDNKRKKWQSFCYCLQAIFVCNALSMFVFNLFAPKKCAKFAHQEKFGNAMKVYDALAALMPYRWRKHWMDYYSSWEGYSDYDQVMYFSESDDIITARNRFKKMTNNALELLWMVATRKGMENPEKVINMFIAFQPKLTDKQFEYLLTEKKFRLIELYISKGPICAEQVKMLIHSAIFGHPTLPLYEQIAVNGDFYTISEDDAQKANTNRSSDCENFCNLLVTYVKKHGLSADLLLYGNNLAKQTITINHENALRTKQAIQAALNVRSQCLYVISQRGENFNEDAWRTYCHENPYICVEAQMKMDLPKYKIFAEEGHMLDEEALTRFFMQANLAMCREIFMTEPHYGFVTEKIALLVNENHRLQKVFYDVLQKRPEA